MQNLTWVLFCSFQGVANARKPGVLRRPEISHYSKGSPNVYKTGVKLITSHGTIAYIDIIL